MTSSMEPKKLKSASANDNENLQLKNNQNNYQIYHQCVLEVMLMFAV